MINACKKTVFTSVFFIKAQRKSLQKSLKNDYSPKKIITVQLLTLQLHYLQYK